MSKKISPSNPNWPSKKTGHTSGKKRGNNPPKAPSKPKAPPSKKK